MWHPNVQRKKFYSDILSTTIRIRLTTAAMRCIDKAGGFDAYIYHTPQKKLQSTLGMALKNRMVAVVEKFDLTPPTRVDRLPRPPKKQPEPTFSLVTETFGTHSSKLP